MSDGNFKIDGRSKAARAAKREAARPPAQEVRTFHRPGQYEVALESADVKSAIYVAEGARVRRDSVSRKLCAGSTAVTADDLARWESALSEANRTLVKLADSNPILKLHPLFAAAFV